LQDTDGGSLFETQLILRTLCIVSGCKTHSDGSFTAPNTTSSPLFFHTEDGDRPLHRNAVGVLPSNEGPCAYYQSRLFHFFIIIIIIIIPLQWRDSPRRPLASLIIHLQIFLFSANLLHPLIFSKPKPVAGFELVNRSFDRYRP
jgi:hypothetical protein